MELEIIQNQDLQNLRPIERKILHDFYLSFRVSQGSPDIQNKTLLIAARSYPTFEIEDVPKLNERLLPLVSKLDVPQREHEKKVYDAKRPNLVVNLDFEQAQANPYGFRAQWEFYLALLQRVTYNESKPYLNRFESTNSRVAYELSQKTDTELTAETLSDICTTDIKYQSKDRPERMEGSDSNESFLRTYMVEKRRTGSDAFDVMYKDMWSLLKKLGVDFVKNGEYPSDKLGLLHEKALTLGLDTQLAEKVVNDFASLTKMWEEKHPGQKFFS